MDYDLEAAFDHFLDTKEYDNAESALLSIMRMAFSAGWRAAGGSMGAAGVGSKTGGQTTENTSRAEETQHLTQDEGGA